MRVLFLSISLEVVYISVKNIYHWYVEALEHDY
jgi:hypothetical protein